MENTRNKIVNVMCQCEYTNERNEVIKLQNCNVTSIFEQYYNDIIDLRKNNPKLLSHATADALHYTSVKCKALVREILDRQFATYTNIQTLLAWQDANGNRDQFIK